MESQHSEIISLTIRDRVNFPYILASQLLTIQKAMLNSSEDTEVSRREIEESIMGLVHVLPKVWKDEEYYKDEELAKKKVKVDVRPDWCGLKASIKFCEEHGITAYEEVEMVDPYRMLNACVNLLERRGLISKQTSLEIFPPKEEPDGSE
jgi:hypothetical protein